MMTTPMLLALDTVVALGLMGFIASAALLLYSARVAARRFGTTAADRFWITIAAAVTQIAVIALVLSPAGAVTPDGFLIAQGAIAAGAFALTRRSAATGLHIDLSPARAVVRKPVAATPTQRLLLLLIALFVLLGLALTIVLPIHAFDDRMYRATRAAYWLQHGSILPWPTHNDRQVAFPFGSELLFFWPVLFTRWELLGRLAFFAGVPLCAGAAYTVARQLRATRTAALGGALVLLATPAVAQVQEGLFPEVWVSLFALGAAYFALRAAADPARAAHHLAWVGFFAALAVNAKTTALALLPAVAVVPWVTAPARDGRRGRRRAMRSVLLGGAGGLLLSGLAVTLASNLLRDGHPLGHPDLRAIHTVDPSVRQARTHLARFAVGLIDPPIAPAAVARPLTSLGNAFLRFCRADVPLLGEAPPSPWPGAYAFGIGRYAARYSLPGLLLLPALAVALLLAGAAPGDHRRRRLVVVPLFALPMLFGPVLMVRWMGGMERFWVPAYALGVPVIILLLLHVARRWRWTRYVMVTLLPITALPVVWERAQAVEEWRLAPPAERLLNEPFHSQLPQIPPGSRVLLVASQDVREYGLFRPRHRFANEVTSWGAEPFDATRMQRLLDERRVTHVLVQQDVIQPIRRGGAVDVREMVKWLAHHPDLHELPTVTPGVRLFRRAGPLPASAPSPLP